MKRIITGLIALLSMIIFSCQQKSAEQIVEAVPVQVYVVRPDSISSYISLTGSLEAGQEAYVYSKISERLEKIYVSIGQRVKRDQVLGEQANALWQQGLKQAEAGLTMARTQFDLVKQEFERMQRLYQEKAISQQQFDQSQAQFQQAQAQLEQARAAYQQAFEQYENTLLKAPFEGQVASINFEEGQMIPAGQPVFKLVNDNFLEAKLFVPEGYWNKLQIGQRVIARFPAVPDQPFVGKIQQIDRAVDPLTRTLKIKVVLQNHAGLLRSGMYGEFQVEILRRGNAIVIPDNAILSRTEVFLNPETGLSEYRKRFFAYVVKDARATLVYVTPGIESDGRIEIVQGLSPGDSLIVIGQKLVKPEQPVRVVND